MSLLTAILPMQLSFGAAGELGVGWDTTAVNPRSGAYADAPLVRPAIDLQAVHIGDSVRQYLRNRTEFMYEGIGGRDIVDSDFLNVTRYTLFWQASEETTLSVDGSYAIGSPTLFFSRAGRADVSFARPGLAFQHWSVADYSARLTLSQHVGEEDALQLEGAVVGRYPIVSQPAGQYMFTPYALAQWTHNVSDDDRVVFGARGEYLSLELFRPVWSAQAYGGWSRNWDEDTNTTLELGAAVIQTNVGPPGTDWQPFVLARAYRTFPRQRIVLGASYSHTFGVVSATLGTGVLDILTAAGYWRPNEGPWVAYATAAFQSGEGYNPESQQPLSVMFASTGVGARYIFRDEHVRLFAQYDFQWEHSSAIDAMTPTPDFVRHVFLVGVQYAWATDEEGLSGLVPIEQIQALDAARGRSNLSPEMSGSGTDPIRFDEPRQRRNRLPGDPSDEELERRNREHEPQSETPLPGDSAHVPGQADMPDGADPFREDNAGDER